MATTYGSNRDVGNSINSFMKLIELFEYQLFKSDAGFKIYRNPSAKDIRLLLQNSYILSQLDLDLSSELQSMDDMDDEYVHHGGNIHGLDYPLRGIVTDGAVYIVDSFDADHESLSHALRNQGIDMEEQITIAIEKATLAPRGDLEDYKIGAAQFAINTLKTIPAVQRLNMPVSKWN